MASGIDFCSVAQTDDVTDGSGQISLVVVEAEGDEL